MPLLCMFVLLGVVVSAYFSGISVGVEAFVGLSSFGGAIHHGTNGIKTTRITPFVVVCSKNTDSDEEDDTPRPRRRVVSSSPGAPNKQVEVGRRGTLMTLLGGAMSLAASDALLGAAGGLVNGGRTTVASSSSVYGIQWNGLYQRMASMTAKHEAAVASPELLSWISKSPAIVGNPQLRAWVAAQRVFSKSRQVMAVTTAGLEEGMAAAAGAVAAAAVASSKKNGKNSDESLLTDESDTSDHDTAEADTSVSMKATSVELDELTSPDVFLSLSEENDDTAARMDENVSNECNPSASMVGKKCDD